MQPSLIILSTKIGLKPNILFPSLAIILKWVMKQRYSLYVLLQPSYRPYQNKSG